ncbi:hypothetical protein [Iningainema tapete]|uniref:Uncharacterized protein n=1 Tax=Iningainema tapete BLCC-T55 TaxID=2748662 RepID=A0A8J7C707_9CYAN|nr:hypothetical protein [Iningainema tapete]MBD2772606.1 hypothetical protein [Iningainema tapete BLCC-T55]
MPYKVQRSDLEKIGLKPNPLKFDEYARRCPEKLELREGYLGKGEMDAKELLAMSLQCFGLVEVVKLAPRKMWEQALDAAYGAEEERQP